MRFDSLRTAFASIVIAATPAACCGAGPVPTDEVFAIDTTTTSYGNEVNACRVDDLACAALCEKLIGPSGDPDSYLVIEDCFLDETGPMTANVTTSYYYAEECISGRRPPGLDPSPATSWLASCARLEAASVPAFLRIARELELAGAPASLIAAARRSARDEIRHARAIGALARRAGDRLAPVHVRAAPLRDLAELALDNAAEGCAREAFGAVVATHQARCARDPRIRAAMAPIARDETRHAAFSLALDRWARTRLRAAEHRRLTDARRAALADLGGGEPDAGLGLPGRAAFAALQRGTIRLISPTSKSVM